MFHNFIHWIREDFGRFSADGLSWSHQLHESMFLWNVIEGTHVLAIMFFAGTIWMWDLRLMGVAFRKARLTTLSDRVLPITKGAFVVLVVTGIVAFVGRDPMLYYHNIWMRLKMVFLVLALLNILYFDYKTKKTLPEWDSMPPEDRAPAAARTGVPLYVFLGTSLLVALSFLMSGVDLILAVTLRIALGLVALTALFIHIDRRSVTPPRAVKLAGALSLVSWLLVILMGRYIAYDWFNCNPRDQGTLAYTLQSCDTYLASEAADDAAEAPPETPAVEEVKP